MKYTDRLYIAIILLLCIIYVRGLFIPLMNNDSAHHANIALNMHLSGDYASLFDQGRDYMDKPHLLFWLAAFSYHVFGINTFAYKFFSILFTLLGLYSTYRLGKLLYSKRVGKLAALILASSLAFILANNDVRMDAILTATIVFATWQLVEYMKFKGWVNVLGVSAGLALGFATKGMVGAMVPLLAAFGFMLHQRNLLIFRDRKWMFIPLLFFLFVGPVLYSYYLQFDLHPEKVIRGQTSVSGVKFILWSQNFERFDGGNFGGRSSRRDSFFFLHTLLWAFLPWSFLLIAGCWNFFKEHLNHRFRSTSRFDGLTLFTIVIMMFLLSFSGYKLPHYLNILFPFFAIIAAAYLLDERTRKHGSMLLKVQGTVVILLFIVALILNGWSLPMDWRVLTAIALAFTATTLLLLRRSEPPINKAVAVSLAGAVLCNLLLNFNWYPKLLKYQAGHVLAEISMNHPAKEYVFLDGYEHSSSFGFYRGQMIPFKAVEAITRGTGTSNVYTGEKGLMALRKHGVVCKIIAAAPDYPVSNLKSPFLDPDKRRTILRTHFLIEAKSSMP